MKVLVTGSKGQVGMCLQDTAKKYPEIQFVFTDKEELDITNKETVRAYFNDQSFDYCINCAAYTAVDLAETHRKEAYLINAEAVRNLAEVCLKADCILIHISTDFVFDGKKSTPYTEEDEPNPINVYGESKLKGEHYCQQLLTKYFIIRTSWLYSEYGHNFVKTMLRLSSEKDSICVVDDQIGSPTYAGNLAELVLNIIIDNNSNFGLYHFSNKGAISWHEFAIKIFELKGINIITNPIPSSMYKSKAKRPDYSVLNNEKTQNNLRIDLSNWEVIIKEFILNRLIK